MNMSFIGSDKTLKKCIDDLESWGIIEILQRGTNQHVPTKAKIAAAFLRKHCESTTIANDSAVVKGRQQYNRTTTAVRSTKTVKTNKPSNTKKMELFELFYGTYGKKVGKANAMKEWDKLSESEQQLAIEGIDRYKKYQPDATYRKDPERYLKGRLWESEFETLNSSDNKAPLNGHPNPPNGQSNKYKQTGKVLS
jgi:hypothetical protein